jgi:hypothetical protein
MEMALALKIHLVLEWGGLLLPCADITHYTIAAHNLAFGKCDEQYPRTAARTKRSRNSQHNSRLCGHLGPQRKPTRACIPFIAWDAARAKLGRSRARTKTSE